MATAPTLGALLVDRSHAAPDAPFLDEWSSSGRDRKALHFAGFHGCVAAAAKGLAKHGIAAGNRVAMLSHPSVIFYVHAFAVMVMGGACALLNWRQPASVLSSMFSDSGCTALLSSSAFVQQVRANGSICHASKRYMQCKCAACTGE